MTSVASMDLRSIAAALGGEVFIVGQEVRAPGPRHSPKDRSLSVKLSSAAPDGFVVHSFADDDDIECRDFVRARCGADPFKPGNGNGRRATASPMPSDEIRKAANERKR